jgi:hypothetical protein
MSAIGLAVGLTSAAAAQDRRRTVADVITATVGVQPEAEYRTRSRMRRFG